MIAKDYAKALFELERPTMNRLREALARRGHLKLLPNIFAQYQKLELQKQRFAKHAEVTPKRERTRILLELYTKLVTSETK